MEFCKRPDVLLSSGRLQNSDLVPPDVFSSYTSPIRCHPAPTLRTVAHFAGHRTLNVSLDFLTIIARTRPSCPLPTSRSLHIRPDARPKPKERTVQP